ncbi:MAG: ATPase, T2SS/T4P/T4SS family [Gemmataceae bacterium]
MTPNKDKDPNQQPKKPTSPAAGTPPAAKKPADGAAKPAGPKPAAKPGEKPAAPQQKKPAAKPADKKPTAKPRDKSWSAEGGSRKIGQILVDLGFLDEGQLWDILEEARNNGVRVGQVAVSRGLINDDQLLQAVAEQHNLKVVNLEDQKPNTQAVGMVQETMATVYKILPLTFENGVLTVVMADPGNLQALDDLRNFLGIQQVQAVLAPPRQIEEAIKTAYSGRQDNIADLIAELNADASLVVNRKETSIDLDSLMEVVDAAPVRKLINMVLLMAIRDHASDIHFEPFEDEYKMRYRCDGILYEMVPPPRHLAMAISSRIKVMSNLDIAERRLPQDGRIELNVGGNPVDMRVSVLPTMFGESVVIRVLDRTVVSLDLTKCGFEPDLLEKFRHLIHKPNGITLVTGPTGAGKTTTLYSALNELNVITDKIITTEDPVEYEIDGIMQCPINHDIDLTFAAALRSILRQDPDIILVGEIRDLETAQIAVQASLTGHMVFSTLHTNDAPSTITRLRDMGVEPFLITATVEGILAQRLVRKICTNCREEFTPSAEMVMELGLKPNELKGRKFFYGAGCEKCNNLGFRGRGGLFELIMMDDEIRDLISAGASTDVLRNHIRARGVPGLREAGLKALQNGITTIEEVVRETVLETDT